MLQGMGSLNKGHISGVEAQCLCELSTFVYPPPTWCGKECRLTKWLEIKPTSGADPRFFSGGCVCKLTVEVNKF